MASGNFLIGSDLRIEGFNKYVMPLLKEKGCTVRDRLSVLYDEDNKTILASISGEGDLEAILNNTLIQAGENIEIQEKGKKQTQSNYALIAWKYQVIDTRLDGDKRITFGNYKTLGVYSSDNTATQLFPVLAQKYLAAETKQKIDELTEQIKGIGERLSEMS